MNDRSRARYDESLLAELRAAAGRADPPPPHLLEALRASLSWRDLDAELAELVFDSVTEDRALAGLRGGGAQERLLTFEAQDVAVELSVQTQRTGRTIVGQVVPAQHATIEVRSASSRTATSTDELGRFRLHLDAGGPVSLRCRLHGTAGPRIVDTDWLPL